MTDHPTWLSPQLITRLLSNAQATFPNDKDLISTKLRIAIVDNYYYLLSDDKGYITYVSSLEDLHECLRYPGDLRRLLEIAPAVFYPRKHAIARSGFDVTSIEI